MTYKIHYNYIILIMFLCFSIVGCSQTKSLEDERKETMTKIIRAFAVNDTSVVYNLIDTSFCFGIVSKEGFTGDMIFLNRFLSENKIELNNSDFKSVPVIPKNNSSYKIMFTLPVNDKFDSFAVKFDFNYWESKKVYFFEVLYFAKPGKEEPFEKVYQ